MSATITWVIEWMNCKPAEGSFTDVVVNAGWRCNGIQDTFNATMFGAASFSMPEGAFTPYDQLTQTQVLGWCWANGVDQAAVEANIQLIIDAQMNPPTVQLPLPWVTA